MGFQAPEELRAKFLTEISIEMLQFQGQNAYGERYQAIVVMTGPVGVSWHIRTGWIVLFGEDAARFVTAFPERFGRQA